MHIEEELRFIVPDDASLAHLGFEGRGSGAISDLVDVWYIPSNVASYDLHESWLSSGRGAPVRIRCRTGSDESCHLEVKALERAGDYSYAREVSIGVRSASLADAFLVAAGFVRAALVQKHRLSVRHDEGVRVCLDDYGRLGRIIEVEREANCTLPEGRDALASWFLSLAGRRFEETLVPMALRAIRGNLASIGGLVVADPRQLVGDDEFAQAAIGCGGAAAPGPGSSSVSPSL